MNDIALAVVIVSLIAQVGVLAYWVVDDLVRAYGRGDRKA